MMKWLFEGVSRREKVLLLVRLVLVLLWVIGMAWASAGCSLLPRPRAPGVLAALVPMATAEECKTLDRAQLGWTLSATGAGALAAGGTLTAAVDSQDTTVVIAVTVTSIGLNAFAGIAAALASRNVKFYTVRCTRNTGGTP